MEISTTKFIIFDKIMNEWIGLDWMGFILSFKKRRRRNMISIILKYICVY